MAIVPFSLRPPLVAGALLLALTVSATAVDAATLQIDLGSGSTLDLVRLEPGTFVQGSPEGTPQRRDDETARTVSLTRPFYLGKYPVTRGQFTRFASETNYRTEAEVGTSGGYGWDGKKLVQRRDFTWKNPGFPQSDSHPVTIVTYKDAKAFLAWLSRKSGRRFELPTEAQWEYACRTGTTTAYVNGDDPARVGDIGWFKDNADQGTQAVDAKPLNAWGLGDMPGNVWQWCEDWYGPYPGGDARDPLQANSALSDKPRRVLRGGSWLRPATDLRSAARYRNDAASRNCDNGFRVMTFDVAAPAPATPRPLPALETTDRVHVPDTAPATSEPSHDHRPSSTIRVRTPNNAAFGFGTIAAVLALIGLFVVIIFKAVKSGGIGAQPGDMATTNYGPVRARVVDDGFWIESSSLPVGSIVQCRYQAGGRSEQKDVVFQGGGQGQFVFTGSRPENVSIVVQPSGGSTDDSDFGRTAGMASSMFPPPIPNPPPIPSRRPSARRNPPAY